MATIAKERGYKARIKHASAIVCFFFKAIHAITTCTNKIVRVSAKNSQAKF
jgi:hypothetical protein